MGVRGGAALGGASQINGLRVKPSVPLAVLHFDPLIL